LNPSINPYFLPLHKDIFVNDLIRTGNIVEVIGNDIFIRKSSLTLSATTFSSYFSAVSAIPSQVETHQIKGYTSNHGTKMWVDINNGQVYDIVSPNWTSVACSTLSAMDAGSSASSSVTNSTMGLSGGYRTLTTGATFVIPAGIYHSCEFVLLSGDAWINNNFRLSTDNNVGQRSKNYTSTVANNQNMFLPALTVSAVSGSIVQWDGLYPTV
jgi:hypothetical protein